LPPEVGSLKADRLRLTVWQEIAVSDTLGETAGVPCSPCGNRGQSPLFGHLSEHPPVQEGM